VRNVRVLLILLVVRSTIAYERLIVHPSMCPCVHMRASRACRTDDSIILVEGWKMCLYSCAYYQHIHKRSKYEYCSCYCSSAVSDILYLSLLFQVNFPLCLFVSFTVDGINLQCPTKALRTRAST